MESSENVTVEYLPQELAVTRRPELIPNRSDGTRFLHSEFDGMNQQRCEKERERERDRDPERETLTHSNTNQHLVDRVMDVTKEMTK